ncbi:MAG: peroxiredoxin family protein [Sphingobacteriales bacterium]
MTTNYQEGLSQLRGQLVTMLPAEALEAFDKDAQSMQADFKNILQLSVGQKAPNFTLPNAIGKNVNLYDTLNNHIVVLVFYRGEWCPYCNLQLSILQKDLDKFKVKAAAIIAISPQNPDSTLSLIQKQNLEFEVLSDAQNSVAKKYTRVFRMSDPSLDILKNLGYDFDSFYTDNSKEIPVPAIFVIAEDGTVLFAKSEGGDYRNRVETEEILKSINS